ncbi:MAG TPA: glycoside hydrolase family 57 protein [Bryobacteraceae bacterium]|nr:glycoside hydrolase family 57 protein [Bryobacteraceae bacterium]
MAKIHLCFVWHMHQPFYKDLVTGEYRLPWTRFHALKDYYGMVKVLEDFPNVHQTFNLVPSMLVQIEEYASGKAADPFLDCAVKPAIELSPAEQQFVLKYFFQANASRMIYRYPRYGELYDAFLKSGADPRLARRLFSFQDLRDLQVLSQLAWFDEEFQERDPEVRALIAKERRYTLEDQALMARKQREILGKVVPVYREFAARGQIEISTTPFYHPILPLICDSNIASVSHPNVALPDRFRYPQDARHQLQTAREFMQHEFGLAPVGLWPSEGSVSDEALSIAAETGFEWAATDNGVLARTLHQTAGPELTYRSYLWQQGGRQLRMIFRDHFLSDQVGFVYSRMGASEAAEQFLESIRANARPLMADGSDVLVPIILDGENAWEYYYQNGRPFLRELYTRISQASDLDALTVSEALKIDQPRPLDHIFPGSWIDANFDVWIGAQEDNTAWEYLLRARQKFDEAASRVPEQSRRLAFEELMIAEGSDWCWWYGPEHQSENRPEFDELYRQHLTNVYRALNLAVPEELSRPILTRRPGDFHEPPANAIHAVIDGEVTSYFEWMGAGRYRSDVRSGAMHGARNVVRELYYGADESSLYVRLDFDNTPELTGVELRTKDKTTPLSNNPAVESALRKIFEARVPFEVLGLSQAQAFSFQVALLGNNVPLEVIPPEGWIEFTNSSA